FLSKIRKQKNIVIVIKSIVVFWVIRLYVLYRASFVKKKPAKKNGAKVRVRWKLNVYDEKLGMYPCIKDTMSFVYHLDKNAITKIVNKIINLPYLLKCNLLMA